jgi:hypothetical protein
MRGMSSLSATIEEYYRRIDAVDIDWVIDLFRDDARYQRADAVYEGKGAIDDFFRSKRKIRGQHIIDGVSLDSGKRTVIASGRFEGVGEAGDGRSVGFADFWRFDDGGKVMQRTTYLAVGHQIVER